MQWPLSDNLTTTIIAGIFGAFAAWFAGRVQTKIKSGDAASAGLSAQIGGWGNLVREMREYADDLDGQLRALRQEMSVIRAQHEDCQRRLSALEGKLS